MIKFSSVITIFLIVFFASIIVYSVSTGITGVTRKGSQPGCICHNSEPSGEVTVTINGPDQMAPGETAEFSVTITGGPLQRAGTNIASSSGVLEPIGSDLQKMGEELTHELPKAPNDNMVTFPFNYTAPEEPGEITLYANGNSVNFNGQNTGDQWNFAPDKIVTVNMPTDVDDQDIVVDEYKLEQNYPNPFNPATKINFNIPEAGDVKLIIYNSIGDEVRVLINEYKNKGNYTEAFNADDLASGVYYYKLIAGNFSETKKMLLLK